MADSGTHDGGKPTPKPPMNYQEPKGPIQPPVGPGPHGDNKGTSGTQGKH
jgi:hypothetical protein